MALSEGTKNQERGSYLKLSSFLFMQTKAVKKPGFWLALIVMLLLGLPVISLIFIAMQGANKNANNIAFLIENVLPHSSLVTLKILIGVAVGTSVIGAVTAWLITFFCFPGRSILSWGLMLPLAVPTYLASYGMVEFFSFTGPLQETYRAVMGYKSAQDYSLFSANGLFDIRSIHGAVFIFSFVLYPYVYLSTRALFQLQGARLMEVARSLGANQWRVFYRILLPLARPAVALGVSLALMETINDIGAMEYLGVKTLTFSVFSVWLNQGDIAGAAQLSLVLLMLVLVLIAIERISRLGQQFFEARYSTRSDFSPVKLSGFKAAGALLICILPVLFGFVIPFYSLSKFAWVYIDKAYSSDLWAALSTSLLLAAVAALVTVAIALILAYVDRVSKLQVISTFVRFSTLGYAVPGTIIALGIFLPLAQLDNWMDGLMRNYVGISTGLLITGSGVSLIYAYVVRFMAMGEGQLHGAFKKISPSQDMAARSLGRSNFKTLTEVLLPSLRPAIASACILVFIDCLKELSATIMLRPFGINTLATYIYDYASQARVEEAGLAAIIIVIVSIIPVIILSKTALHKG